MENKHIVYIEAGSDIPFISFGSRAAFNAVVNNINNINWVYYCVETLNDMNRCIICQTTLSELRCLIDRLGFIEVQWIEDEDSEGRYRFFDNDNTRKIMEGWDDGE